MAAQREQLRSSLMINVQVYRYNAERDAMPYMQSLQVPDEFRPRMVLDVLEYLHEQDRSEEHTSELQSRENLVCRLLLEQKKQMKSRGIFASVRRVPISWSET